MSPAREDTAFFFLRLSAARAGGAEVGRGQQDIEHRWPSASPDPDLRPSLQLLALLSLPQYHIAT